MSQITKRAASTEDLVLAASQYLKSLVCQVLEKPTDSLDVDTPFGDYGVDSFYVLKIVKKLEADFGRLPKTLLFEYINLSELGAYFVTEHAEVLLEKLQAVEVSELPTVNKNITKAQKQTTRLEESNGEFPVIVVSHDLANQPNVKKVVDDLYEKFKNEGSVSRGTNEIAPYIFLAGKRKGYFNLARKGDIVLAYSYTGESDDFLAATEELANYCKNNSLKLNLMTDEVVSMAGGLPFTSTPFGAVQRIKNLSDFSLSGGKMRRLRYLVSKFEKLGDVETKEYENGSDPEIDRSIIHVIDQWCAERAQVNPLVAVARAEIAEGKLSGKHRLFTTFVNQQLVNVILITSISTPSDGYLMDLEFYPPDMPLGGLEYTIIKIIQTLVDEGRDLLSLGATLGPKLEPSPNEDKDLDAALEELREREIFDDQGNLQFKNKFRPENKTIFLCRPQDYNRADDIIDVIMMIADPVKSDTFPHPSHETAESALSSTNAEDCNTLITPVFDSKIVSNSDEMLTKMGSRGQHLIEAQFNVANIGGDKVASDLRTDSWAKIDKKYSERHVKHLYRNINRSGVFDRDLKDVFGFEHILLTKGGAASEKILCRAWQKRGIVYQNILFPTLIFSLLDNGFEAIELPHQSVYDLEAGDKCRSEIDVDRLNEALGENSHKVAFVCLELSNNAAGGAPVSLKHLTEVKSLLQQYKIPLVLDATRILENCLNTLKQDGVSDLEEMWAMVRKVCACADVITASLAKDFGLDRGGLLATNDENIAKLFKQEYDNSEDRLDILDKKIIAAAFSERRTIESLVIARTEAVSHLYRELLANAVPIVKSLTAHCILVDIKRLAQFSSLNHPVESFIACLYLNTGIRTAGHNIGMQGETTLRGLVRIAVPLGLTVKDVEIITRKLVNFFHNISNIPQLIAQQEDSPQLKLHARYDLSEIINVNPDAYQKDPAELKEESLNSSKSTISEGDNNNKTVDEQVFFQSGDANLSKSQGSHVSQDVAIVGLSGRYPDANNVDELWENLRNGRDSIADLPQDRLQKRRNSHHSECYKGGFIDAVDRFDSLFFNISPREAEMLDPQERLFLECAWEALEDAGYYPELLSDKDSKRHKVGVFVGAVWSMYQVLGVEQKILGNPVTPNSFLWSIANRVSYWMNFSGPSLTLDTACSSSLTALYYACEAIRKGECTSAIVGGVNLDLHQHKLDINRFGGALSKDETCKSFGHGANGYVAGEGVAAVFLKPLQDAIADRDHIHGVIKGVGINHGGRTNGYTVPNPRAQADLISHVLDSAKIDPRTVGYVEAHGTGTELGDPIEVSGLTRAFKGCNPENHRCAIGSIKTNIGHLEAAAGLAGVTKVLLQMRNRQLVPSLHSQELNEHIDFDSTPFNVQQTLCAWKAKSLEGRNYPLRGAVSSFGAGGSNAHVLIEEYQARVPQTKLEGSRLIFPISAKSTEQLREFAQRLSAFVTQDQERQDEVLIQNIAYTLQVGKKPFDYRLAILADSKEELLLRLGQYLKNEEHADILKNTVKQNKSIAQFLSSDENAQFLTMLLKDNQPTKIARMWIEGIINDFQFVKSHLDGHRISLPTYPFADKRHWVEHKAFQRGAQENLHPLVDSNVSTFTQQLFKKTFRENEFFIYDHLVSEIPTLPGVAYLDMARATGELAAGRKVSKIYNVIWVSPLVVDRGMPTEATVELLPKGETIQFEVFSVNKAGDKVLCCQGKIAYADEPESNIEDEYIDIAAIKKQCEHAILGSDAYPKFKSLGLNLGPSFQVLKDVYKSDNEILGVLEIPECRLTDFGDFLLHPSMMDGALQAGMAANVGSTEGEMFVPYSIGSVEVIHPLSARCYSYIRQESDDTSVLSKANVLITDEAGKVLVKIRDSIGVPLGNVHEKPNEKPNDDPNEQDFKTLYYSYVWKEKSLQSDSHLNNNSNIVFFAESGLQKTILDTIDNADGKKYFFVRQGDENKRVDEVTFQVDNRSMEGFSWLLECLNKSAIKITNFCYAWPLNSEGEGLHIDIGYFSFQHLCQALITSGAKDTRLTYTYASQSDHRQCAYESINGYVHTLHAESPNVRAKIVEFDKDLAIQSKYVSRLVSEIENDDFSRDFTVRYSEGARYIRGVSEFTANKTLDAIPVKERGAYIITGGLGGLGYIFARYLSEKYKAKLVLSGRRELESVIEDKISELESLGGKVRYYSCDVSKAHEVEQLVDECQEQFSSINGIIHAAGILQDGFIKAKTQEEIAAVIAPKISGTLNLDRATKQHPIDFFVTFSSMAAVGGNVGQSDYAYANHYMDTFCRKRNEQVINGERQGKSLSINWSIWADGGMQLDEGTQDYFKTKLGIKPLQTSVGFEAFLFGLRSKLHNFVVVDAQKELMEDAWGISQKENPKASMSEANINVSDIEGTPRQGSQNDNHFAAVKQDISQMVKDFLKLSDEDLDTESLLLDLGFDSIGLATFANQINDKYSLELTPVMFFEYPNIEKVSGYIASQSDLLTTESLHSEEETPTTLPDKKVGTVGFSLDKGYTPSHVTTTRHSSSQNVQSFVANRFIDEPIAIVGMSGVMPQSDDLDEYWEKLIGATDNMVTLVPPDRWSWEEYYGDPLKEENKTKAKWGGFMREVDKFDPLFFGISPREAEMMDPQQRIFLQTVCGAIEDSGHKLSDLAGTKTGLFVGASTREYLDLMGTSDVQLDGYSASGTSHAILANRISYLLDLRGPSAPLDTACSSSLVALHRAIESIHTGSSEMAIVGGVQVMLTPAGFISFSAAGMLADDGRCKTFDESANGYVRGEGSGAILIKTLSKAKQDGDQIYALVRSTAENHGGKATMLTAPNRKAQTDVIVEAYEKAGVDPRSVGFVECHGTGTSLGDPIEVDALKNAFDILYKKNNITNVTPHIGLTSAKTNIGHLETAAGIAGLLKVLLAIKHKKIPPLLHFNKLNPYIDLDSSPFYLVNEPTDWEVKRNNDGNEQPRLAGLSSFGFGGANVHVVLEEYCEDGVLDESAPHSPHHIFVLSAKNQDSLEKYASSIYEFISVNTVRIDDLAYTSQVGRDAYESRLAIVADSTKDLLEKLEAYLDGHKSANGLHAGEVKRKDIANFSDDEAIKLFESNKHEKMAALWCEGKHINWEACYQRSKLKRVHFPTYPFARERYWFEKSDVYDSVSVKGNIESLHPLVHQNVSDISGVEFLSYGSRLMEYLRNRPVSQEEIQSTRSLNRLQPPELIEIANFVIRLASKSSETAGIELTGLEFYSSPCGEYDVVTSIGDVDTKTGNTVLNFNINTVNTQKQTKRICLGKASAVASRYPAKLDLEFLRKKIDSVIDIKPLTNDPQSKDIRSGASRSMSFNEICYKDGQVFARLKQKDSEMNQVDARLFVIAAMLEITKTAYFSMRDIPLGSLNVIGLDSIRLQPNYEDARFVWVYPSQVNDEVVDSSPVRYDLVFSDEQGNVCIRVHGLEMVERHSHQTFDDLQSAKDKLLLLKPEWQHIKKENLELAPSRSALANVMLTLGVHRKIISDIRQAFPMSKHVDLALSDNAGVDLQFQECLREVINIVKTIPTDDVQEKSTIRLIVDESVPRAIANGIQGFFRSLMQENGLLRIEIHSLGFGCSVDNVIQHLGQLPKGDELLVTHHTADGPMCLKWVQDDWHPERKQFSVFGNNKNYLITGGLGKLGMLLTRSILESTINTRVVLTSRQTVKASRLSEVFGDHAARVVCEQLDFEDSYRAIKQISDISQAHGPINGVIHAAGSTNDGFFDGKPFDEFCKILNPKVAGLCSLDEATKSEPLDFFILFSSVVSVLGNAGQTDYGAANGFMDGFAEQRNALTKDGKRSGKCMAINWPLWQEGGMTISQDAERLLFEMTGMQPLPSQIATEIINHCVCDGEDQSLVLYGDIEKLGEPFGLSKGSGSTITPFSSKETSAVRQRIVTAINSES